MGRWVIAIAPHPANHPQPIPPNKKEQAQACLERAREYVLERKQFGKPLAENQHVQFKLADMATDLVTARYVFGVF